MFSLQEVFGAIIAVWLAYVLVEEKISERRKKK